MFRNSANALVKGLGVFGLLSGLLISCGDGQNFNTFLIADNEDQAVDHLVDRATYHFDRGELDKASLYADKAHAINPSNEEAVLIKGYISLSQAGAGIFELTKKLMDLGDDSSGAASLMLNTAESANDATSFLSQLGGLVGDQDALNKIKGPEKVGTGAFVKLNYRPPLPASESRTKQVQVIDKTNEALTVICPLVNSGAKVLGNANAFGDVRHEADFCAQASRESLSSARIHFIWSLAHLMEGTAFNLVLVPALTTLEKQAAAASVKPGEVTENGVTMNIPDSVAAFADLVTAIDDILPSGSGAEHSMLNGMLNDLDATAKGFAQIPGIPDEMVSKLTEAIDSFRSKQSQFANAGQNAGASSLKDQLLGTVSSKVSEYISDPPPGMTPAQTTDACASLKSISPTQHAALVASGKCTP